MAFSTLGSLRRWTFLFLVIGAACGRNRTGDEQGGELVWLRHEFRDTPVRPIVVAERRFKDPEGRVTKAICYEGAPSRWRHIKNGYVYKESDLRVCQIHLYAYDQQGRVTQTAYHTPRMQLEGTDTNIYDSEGRLAKRLWHGAQGTLIRESRMANGQLRTAILFDATGEKTIGIRGDLPTDVDLAYGWGAPVDGVSCAIAPNRTRGRPADIHICITEKNDTNEKEELLWPSEFLTLQMELRNAAGELQVPQEELYKKKYAVLQPRDRKAAPPPFSIPPHSAAWPGRYYKLDELYGDLKPGTYTLTMRHRSKIDEQLVSNAITLSIDPRR